MKKPKLVDMGPVGQSCFSCGLRGVKKDKCETFKRKIKLTQWCDGWEKWVKKVPVKNKVEKVSKGSGEKQ